MLSKKQVERITPKLLLIQIISAGILVGAIVFAVLIAVVVDWKTVSSNIGLITLIGAATGVSIYCLALVVPRILAAASVDGGATELINEQQELDEEKAIDSILESLQSNQIIFSAMLEGAIFLNLMAFLVDKSLVSMAVAGLGLAIMLLAFPFKSRLVERLTGRLQNFKDDLKLNR